MSILKGTVACACACYSSAMDKPPDPNQPKAFKFPQRSFGVKNPVKKVFRLRGLLTELGCNSVHCVQL